MGVNSRAWSTPWDLEASTRREEGGAGGFDSLLQCPLSLEDGSFPLSGFQTFDNAKKELKDVFCLNRK